MKQRIFSLSCVAFAAAWLAWPMAAFGQPAAAPEAGTASSSPAPSIPAELSAEARTQYEAQMKILRAQVDAAKWKEALATAEAMNKERPREPQARFLKTIALTELGRDNEAERELLTLVADYPELPEPHNNLATLYAKRGEYELARRELELALIAVPDYGIAHANLADLYLQQAINHYRRAAELIKNSKDSRALRTRADTIQTLLVPEKPPVVQADKTVTPAKSADTAKDEKGATKEGEKDAAKEGDFLSIGCEAPGADDKDEDVFSNNGTCDINFDEPAPEKKEGEDGKGGKDEKNEKAPAPAPAPKP